MIKLKAMTVKNFLSSGNATQTILFTDRNFTLVLGENLDMGGDGNRNGVGKSLMIQALSYVLFGASLTKIKADNLVNKSNNKEMMVTLDYEHDGIEYRIERGRKPSVFRYFINDGKFEPNSHEADDTHGESKITQAEINKTLGFSRELFRHIIALNTITIPFLSEGAGNQRSIIEELLGITMLSEKAETLKKLRDASKLSISEENIKLDASKNANARIQGNIDKLKLKSNSWVSNKEENVKLLQTEIDVLSNIDVDKEIEAHKTLEIYINTEKQIKQLDKSKVRLEKDISRFVSQRDALEKQLEDAKNHQCPTCGQQTHDDKHDEIIKELSEGVNDLKEILDQSNTELDAVVLELSGLSLGDKPEVILDSIEDAYNHKNSLDNLNSELQKEMNSENPYTEQITQLQEEGLEDISYDKINYLTKLHEHQVFLYKLLTNKDSFIRKKIIDQNLSYLNYRLNDYLEKLGLPHEVRFLNDLSVEIQRLGKDFDFDNLSRGERSRLILSLSLAFRDVWESLNGSLNLLFVDELIDNGIDPAGAENALSILKDLGRNKGKDVLLVSHREDLISRATNVMMVKFENGFTTFGE